MHLLIFFCHFDEIVDQLKTEFINEKIDFNKFMNYVESLEQNKAAHIIYKEIKLSEQDKSAEPEIIEEDNIFKEKEETKSDYTRKF